MDERVSDRQQRYSTHLCREESRARRRVRAGIVKLYLRRATCSRRHLSRIKEYERAARR